MLMFNNLEVALLIVYLQNVTATVIITIFRFNVKLYETRTFDRYGWGNLQWREPDIWCRQIYT